MKGPRPAPPPRSTGRPAGPRGPCAASGPTCSPSAPSVASLAPQTAASAHPTIPAGLWLAWAFAPAALGRIVGCPPPRLSLLRPADPQRSDQWLPPRYWALAVPLLICSTVLATFLLFVGKSYRMVPSGSSVCTVRDGTAASRAAWQPGPAVPRAPTCVIPPHADIHLVAANRVLYGQG